jgi:hypothetical protein
MEYPSSYRDSPNGIRVNVDVLNDAFDCKEDLVVEFAFDRVRRVDDEDQIEWPV